VQAAHDLHSSEGLLLRITLADHHEAGHFLLGEADLLAAEFGLREIADLVR